MNQRLLTIALIWGLLGVPTQLQAFDLKNLFESNPIEAVEVSWRDLVQYDYQRNIVPPQLKNIQGKMVRIPGYVVPLLGDFGGDFETLQEFLLVPVYGMCIHVPPPPPNQVIYVQMQQPVEVEKLFDAVWVTGELRIEVTPLPNTQGLTYEPEGGFQLTGVEVEIYQRE